MHDRGMLIDRRSLAEEKIQEHVLEPVHERRRHEHRMNADDQKTKQEMDCVKPESGAEIETDLPLLSPKKASRMLHKPRGRIFHCTHLKPFPLLDVRTSL
jgi:hypothetical protein